jgi:glycosyltransferase involved in cell wall biosynthesis
MKPLHLLLVHQAFATPNEAGGTRHYELGQHWVAAGNKLTVIASDRNHLTGELVPDKDAADRGIRIKRTYTMPTLHRSFLWRVIAFFSFSVTSLVAGLRTKHVDIVMGTTPPMPQAPTAWLIAALKRKPFLLEVRDLWPEFAIDMGVLKNKLVIAIARRLEDFLYARADHILVNSPAYRDYLVQKKSVPATKVTVIANGVDPGPFKDSRADGIRERLGVNGEFIAMYAGALGVANDIPVVLEAAKRLQSKRRSACS